MHTRLQGRNLTDQDAVCFRQTRCRFPRSADECLDFWPPRASSVRCLPRISSVVTNNIPAGVAKAAMQRCSERLNLCVQCSEGMLRIHYGHLQVGQVQRRFQPSTDSSRCRGGASVRRWRSNGVSDNGSHSVRGSAGCGVRLRRTLARRWSLLLSETSLRSTSAAGVTAKQMSARR